MAPATLHNHSEFSARDSLLRVHELPQLAKSLGWSAVAITDHGAVEGTLPFLDACREHGIKGISGVELYLSTPDSDKYHHLTVLAKNAKGWSAMCAALSAATEFSVGNKRRLTACPLDVALEVLHDVVVLSGCFSSPFWRITHEADINAGRPDLDKWVEKFGDDFFFEVQPLDDWSEQIRLNRHVLGAAKEYGRPVVVTPDCHFGTAEDGILHDALLALAHRAVLGSDDDKWKFSTKLNYLMTPEVVGQRLSRAGFTEAEAAQAVLTTDRVAERIVDWSFNDLSPSSIPVIDGDFVEMTRAAFDRRPFANDPEYMDRLEEELRVFTAAGLGNYFLLVCECLRLFREHGAMIGPRGSVGGSLIAYVLGIASLDPVAHHIPYWRFWYPGRAMPGVGPDGKPVKGSPPDIDIDLPIAFHRKVGGLLRERFGADKVAQISTVGTFGSRSAVRAAAKTFGVMIPDRGDWEEDKVVRAGATEEEKREALYEIPLFNELPEDAQRFAERLVGRVEKFGAHPGGFVIASEPLTSGRSCVVRRGKGTAMCWDMEAAEKLGFLKIDFLGNASIDALQALSKVESVKDLEAIPLDDPVVLKDFREGRTAGIPQFSTAGMRTFTEMVGPKNFDELVWINAAFRKGAIVAAGGPREMATAYRERPDSIIVYQEELMRFCRELAGLSWDETDKIRKVVAKSKGTEEMAKWHDIFVNGCERVGILDRVAASTLFENLKSASEYLFNHCLAPDTIVKYHDGHAGPIGQVEKGDILVGPDGRPRRVSAKWETWNEAWELTLDDGCRITASSNHRFLTDAGVSEVRDICLWNHGIRIASGTAEKEMALSGMRNSESNVPRENEAPVVLSKMACVASRETASDDAGSLGRSDQKAAMHSGGYSGERGSSPSSFAEEVIDEKRLPNLWSVPSQVRVDQKKGCAYACLQEMACMAPQDKAGNDCSRLGKPEETEEHPQRAAHSETVEELRGAGAPAQCDDEKEVGGARCQNEKEADQKTASDVGRIESPIEQISVGGRSRTVSSKGKTSRVGTDSSAHECVRDRLCCSAIAGGSGWDAPFQTGIRSQTVPNHGRARPETGSAGDEEWTNLSGSRGAGLLHDERTSKTKICETNRRTVERPATGDLEVRHVVGVRKLGYRQLIDIEVDQDHLFLLDGDLVSHNSHASAYAANAFRIAWMKRHDPPKAFATLLNLAPKVEDREPLIDEAHHYKVEIVPPDPNKSGFVWTVEGNRVLAPLQYAEGASMVIAKAIVGRRTVRDILKGKKTVTVGGLFKDQADFTARMGKPGKVAYKGKDGKIKYKSTGIQRPGWFDQRLWHPAPRRTEKPMVPDRIEAQAFREVVKECDRCKLRATCRAPVPPEFGKTNVLVLGQSPGKYEDSRGKPFVGRSGELLFNTLEAHGIERQNVSIANVLSCMPVRDEEPPTICMWADKYIEFFKPPLILAVGKQAWQKVSGMGAHSPGITKMNGTLVHANGYGVVPCIHPAAVLRDMRLIHELDRAVGKFARLFVASLK